MVVERWHPRRPTMKNYSVNVPIAYMALIQQMKKKGLTPSQSEYIRCAIWDKLSRDMGLMRSLIDEDLELPEKRDVFEYEKRIVIDGKEFNLK